MKIYTRAIKKHNGLFANDESDKRFLRLCKTYCDEFYVDDPSIKDAPYVTNPYYTKDQRRLLEMINLGRIEDMMYRTADICKAIAKKDKKLIQAEVFSNKNTNQVIYNVLDMKKKFFKPDVLFKQLSDVEFEFIRLFYKDAIDFIIFDRPSRENAVLRLKGLMKSTLEKPLNVFLPEVMFKTSSDVEYSAFMVLNFDDDEINDYETSAEIIQGRDTQIINCGNTLTLTI